MKFFVLLTTCLLSFPHLSYAMDTGSSASQEEGQAKTARLQAKETLEIPYEKTIYSTNLRPFNVVEFTQKNVEVGFSFDEEGRI